MIWRHVSLSFSVLPFRLHSLFCSSVTWTVVKSVNLERHGTNKSETNIVHTDFSLCMGAAFAACMHGQAEGLYKWPLVKPNRWTLWELDVHLSWSMQWALGLFTVRLIPRAAVVGLFMLLMHDTAAHYNWRFLLWQIMRETTKRPSQRSTDMDLSFLI